MKYWPKVFQSEGDKEEYEWWRASLLLDVPNESFSNIASSYIEVGDESMSVI